MTDKENFERIVKLPVASREKYLSEIHDASRFESRGMTPMTDEQIFEQAVRLAGDERGEFLRDACGDDRARHEHLLLLLSSHSRSDDWLDTEAMSVDAGYYQYYAHKWSRAFLRRVDDDDWLRWLDNDGSLRKTSIQGVVKLHLPIPEHSR